MGKCIVGWAHSKFGKQENETLESLIVQVAVNAIEHAGLEPADIDQIFIGTMNAGMDPQEFPSSLALQASPALRFKPSTRVENACATGSAAIHQGLNVIAAKKARFVLVIGAEKMTGISSAEVGKCLLKASYVKEESEIEGGFVGVFGKIADLYFQRYGDQSEAMAQIAAKNHKNGSHNLLAHVQKDLGLEYCRGGDSNPKVAGPLRRTDCSMVSDGAAAVVLADLATAYYMPHVVVFRSVSHVNDFLPLSKRDIVAFEGPAMAWENALRDARITLNDLSFVETHDCFTIAELMEYEAMGLTPRGQGARAILEGWTQMGGKLPVNPSGGLKAKGHPIGATGVSMHVLSAMQLSNAAGGFQVPNARLAGIFNMGGAAVANYVSILEPLR